MANFVDWVKSVPGFVEHQQKYRDQVQQQRVQQQQQQQQQQLMQQKPAEGQGFWNDTLKNASDVINWDINGAKPIRHLLSILSAPSIGVQNAMYQNTMRAQNPSPERQEAVAKRTQGLTAEESAKGFYVDDFGVTRLNIFGEGANSDMYADKQVPRFLGDFWAGFSAGMTDDVYSPNYKTGSDVVRANNPEWDDAGVFWAGLASDIILDPINLIPGGIVAAGARGAIKGAQVGGKAIKAAEKGAPKLLETAKLPLRTAKGVVAGSGGADAYRVGRFGRNLKPVGLSELVKVRDYQSFETLARQGKIDTQDLFELVDGRITSKQLVGRLAQRAGNVGPENWKAGQKAVDKVKDAAYFDSLKEIAAKYAPNAQKIINNEWVTPAGKLVKAKPYMGAGAAESSYLFRPETSFGSDEATAWAETFRQIDAGGVPATPGVAPTSARVIPVDDATPGVTAQTPMDDGSLPTVAPVHNTTPMTDAEILGISPGMTRDEASLIARHTMKTAHPDSGVGDMGAYESALGAYNRLFNADAATPPAITYVPGLAETGAKVNPTVYDEPLSDAVSAEVRAKNLETLLRFLQENPSVNRTGTLEQSQSLMDEVIGLIAGREEFVAMQMRLGLRSDESVSEFLFGTNRYIQSLTEGEFETVFLAIKMLGELPMDIPGYTDRARKIILQWENAPTEADKWKIITDLGNEYRDAMDSTGALLSEDASSIATSYGNAGYFLDVINGVSKIRNKEDKSKLSDYVSDKETVGTMEQAQRASKEAEDVSDKEAASADEMPTMLENQLLEMSDEDFANVEVLARTNFEASENAGSSVNIFGKIIEEPQAEVIKVFNDSINVALKSKPQEQPVIKGVSAKEFEAMRARKNSANSQGRSGTDSLADRQLVAGEVKLAKEVKAGSRVHLKTPNVPRELDDIYDHVVGYARTSLTLDGWVQSIIRIGRSTAAKAGLARDLGKKLGLDKVPDTAAITKMYANVYARAFQKLENMTVKRDGKDVLDETVGVDFLGRTYRDIVPGDYSGSSKELALVDEIEAQRMAIEGYEPAGKLTGKKAAKVAAVGNRLSGAQKFVAEARRRDSKARLADMRLAQSVRIAKAQIGDLKAVSPKIGDPIAARGTDGAFLEGAAFTSLVLNGSVATNATNRILHAKIVGDGLRNALRRIAPLVQWKTRKQEVFPTKQLVESEEQLLQLSDAITQNSDAFTTAISEKAREILGKNGNLTTENVRKYIDALQRTGPTAQSKFASITERENTWRSYAGYFSDEIPGDLIENKWVGTPWLNMEPITSTIDDFMTAAGINDITGGARVAIWDAIMKSFDVSSIFSIPRLNKERLTKLLRESRIEVGQSRPARIAEIRSGTTEGILRRVMPSMEQYNRDVVGWRGNTDSATPAQKLLWNKQDWEVERSVQSARQYLTYAQQGMKQPDIDQLEQLFKNVEIKVSADGTGKPIALGPDGFREYPPELVEIVNEAFARSFSDAEEIAKAASGTSVATFMRVKNLDFDKAMDNQRALRIRETQAVNDVSMWNGEAIREYAKTIDVPKALETISTGLFKMFDRIRSTGHRNAVDAASSAAFKRVIAKAAKTGRIFRQEGTADAWREVSSVIDKSGLFRAGSVESWNAKMLAMRKLNLELSKSGIFDVSSLTKWGGRTRPAGGIDPDHAYVSLVHIMDALDEVLPNDAMRATFDTFKIDGKSFPTSTLQETAVLAMKMGSTGMEDMGRAAWLHDAILYSLKKHPEGRVFAEQAMANVDSPAARIVAMLASGLSDPKVIASLMNKHKIRAAMAVATAEKKSVAIAKPIMDALTDVADNVFASTGERSIALDRAVDALRAQLAKAGYANGSLEHMLSSKMLESRMIDAFSPMELNIARVERRMKSHEALPPAERVFAVNAERTAFMRSTQKIADEAAIETVARKIATVGDDAAALEEAMDDALHVADIAVEGNSSIFTDAMLGMPTYRQNPDQKYMGILHAQMEDEIKAVRSFRGRAIQQNDMVEAAKYDKQLALIQATTDDIWSVYTALRDGTPIPPLRTSPPATTLDEAGNEILDNTLDGAQPASVDLADRATKSLWGRLSRIFSGAAGNRELLPTAGLERSKLEGSANTLEKNLERAKKFADKSDIQIGRQNEIVASLVEITNPAARKAYVAKLPPEEAQFAEMVFVGSQPLFDGATLARLGVDSDWYVQHLEKSIIGKIKIFSSKFKIAPGLSGEAFVAKYRTVLAEALRNAGTRPIVNGVEVEASYDWLKAMKGVNETLHRAMLMPSIAADFSARYGHGVWEGLDAADARAMGWVQIKPGKDFAKFVDHEQYYPPEMVKELANLQKLFNAIADPVNNKFVYAVDKTNNAIKSSLTLWSVHNHLVNIVGESMTNLMAGVFRPTNYSKAWQTLKDGGYLKNIVAHNKSQTADTFMGDAITGIHQVDAGKGVRVRVGGKNITIPFAQWSDILNQHGIPIMNNTVEDIMYEAGRSVKYNNMLSKYTSWVWKTNRAIGQAAARRDNVFRIAHAIDIAEKGSFRSAKEMMDTIQREIASYHPTMHHLSAFEQKFMRRITFFYTWQRGMLSRTIRTLVENPVAITAVAKTNYAVSGAMGGDPVAYGQTTPNDSELPSWANNFASGVSYRSESGDIVTIDIGHPALSTLQKYLGGMSYNPALAPWENVVTSMKNTLQDNVVEGISPVYKVAQTALNFVESNGGAYQSPDFFQDLTDLTGMGQISRQTGMTLFNGYGVPFNNATGTPFPLRSGYKNQAEFDAARAKAMINYWSPFRFNIPSMYGDSAEIERKKYNQKLEGYADPNNPNFAEKTWGQWTGQQ